jgi:AcrR family transcriptional regulator
LTLSVQKRREKQRAELRSELVDAAHKLVQEEGYEGLTIRKLAKRVGYAPMSVYSYFADKQDILLALAEDAFETLARRIEGHPHEDPVEALRAVLVEYAAFGLENPNEYRTVFMTEKRKPPSFDTAEDNPAMRALIQRVEACVAAGRLKGDARAIATMLWAVGHGAVSLLLTFPFYPFGDQQTFVTRVGEMMLEAIAEHEIAPFGDGRANCQGS